MHSNHIRINSSLSIPVAEIRFRTSRSGGPGGQNVNKLETRVELEFSVAGSPSLSPVQRSRILKALASNIDSEGVLRIVAAESRSQWANKKRAVEKFAMMIRKALLLPKERIRTRPTAISRERRLESKKRHGEKKRRRRSRDSD